MTPLGLELFHPLSLFYLETVNPFLLSSYLMLIYFIYGWSGPVYISSHITIKAFQVCGMLGWGRPQLKNSFPN